MFSSFEIIDFWKCCRLPMREGDGEGSEKEKISFRSKPSRVKRAKFGHDGRPPFSHSLYTFLVAGRWCNNPTDSEIERYGGRREDRARQEDIALWNSSVALRSQYLISGSSWLKKNKNTWRGEAETWRTMKTVLLSFRAHNIAHWWPDCPITIIHYKASF